MSSLTWVFLAAAIAAEVTGTLCLQLAVHGRKGWYAVVGFGYLSALALISLALAGGMPLGIAYGIWAATGVALTAVLSRVFFGEPLTPVMLLGIALVVGGVLCVELGSV